MGVKFLSEEWTRAVQDSLNSNEAFRSAASSQTARIQQVVTSPDGEKRYWFRLEGGEATLGVGDSPDPVDATITQDYDTAAALARGDLTGTAAFMSGKIRVGGDMMKLMQLQGTLGQLPAVLRDLDVDY